MANENAPYTTIHSHKAIEEEIYCAESLIDADGTAFPDSNFEEGYIAALRWVLGREPSNVREEFFAMMEERALSGLHA